LSTIPLDELPEWLQNSAGSQVSSLRERAQSLVAKAMSALEGILEIAKDIGDPDSPWHRSIGDSEKEVATKFGQRVVSLAEKIREPGSATYEDYQGFLESLGEFHRDLIRTGAVWIRRLDRSYKDPVRRMQFQLNELRSSARLLDEHLRERYGEVRRFESLVKEAEAAKSSAREIQLLQEELRLSGVRADELRGELRKLESSRNQLERSSTHIEAKNLERQIEEIRASIKRLLSPLEKPFDKFLRLPDKERTNVRPDVLQTISDYARDTIGTLSVEQGGLPRLRLALPAIRKALEADKLELKGSRVRAALKSISQIQEEDELLTLRDEYMKTCALRDQTLQSEQMRELLERRRQLGEKEESLKTELGRAERSARELIARLEELTEKLADQKEKMERAVKSITGQIIQLS